MRRPVCGSSNGQEWSGVLYFQLCRGEHGDELRVYVRDRVHRWWIPSRLSLSLRDQQIALEEPTLRAETRQVGAPAWDDGFCHVPSYELAAARGFEDSVGTGDLVLTLSGTRVWGTFRLVRTQSSEVPQWLIWRASTIEQVA